VFDTLSESGPVIGAPSGTTVAKPELIGRPAAVSILYFSVRTKRPWCVMPLAPSV
jgi:hypothetical protein